MFSSVKRKRPFDIAFYKSFYAVIPLALFIVFIASTEISVKSFNITLDYCIYSVIPSLFPFSVLSILVTELGIGILFSVLPDKPSQFLFGIPSSCLFVVFIGLLSGFPIGAKTACQMYKQGYCSKSECERIIAFCSNASPAFVISAVGISLWNNASIGIILFISQTISAWIIGFILSCAEKNKYYENIKPMYDAPSKNIFTATVSAVCSSTFSLINVSGFIIFFSVCLSVFSHYGLISHLADFFCGLLPFIEKNNAVSVLSGMLEFTCGLRLSSEIGGINGLVSSAIILGFSGFSVFCQVSSCVSDTDISLKKFFLSKVFCAILTPIFSYILYFLFIKL